MEGRAKVTKEVLCEEARFILANVMAEARYGRQNRYDDIRRVCEGAVSIPFSEYIGFLEKSGYLRHDRANESLEVSPEGETVVNGGNLAEFTDPGLVASGVQHEYCCLDSFSHHDLLASATACSIRHEGNEAQG